MCECVYHGKSNFVCERVRDKSIKTSPHVIIFCLNTYMMHRSLDCKDPISRKHPPSLSLSLSGLCVGFLWNWLIDMERWYVLNILMETPPTLSWSLFPPDYKTKANVKMLSDRFLLSIPSLHSINHPPPYPKIPLAIQVISNLQNILCFCLIVLSKHLYC